MKNIQNIEGIQEVQEKKVRFTEISINIASPETIMSWSKGEIKSAETINYRTFKSETGGILCEKIFGPEKDYECSCGRYKGKKYENIICDRCGVEIVHSNIRRSRMGHISLAIPISHIWFFKCIPSYLGVMLDITSRSLEKVLYYREFIVTDPGDTSLTEKQLLSDEQYEEALNSYGEDSFSVSIGAEAIKILLEKIEVDAYLEQLKTEFKIIKSKADYKKLAKKITLFESFIKNKINPVWMILTVLPVLPADLRPLVPLQDGRFATSDLNDLYRRVINRNNRLKKLLKENTPDVIIRNEKRMLQESIDSLLDNGRHKNPVMAAGNRPLKSLCDMLKGKSGRFRQNLLGKRVDFSGRSVIVVGPELALHQCGLPKKIALTLFQPFVINYLIKKGYALNVKNARKMIEDRELHVWDALEEVTKGHPILFNRAPSLHRLSIQAFEPILIEGFAIRLHPLVCTAFNADFDGDQMAVHIPLSNEAQLEAKLLMLAPNNIFSPSSGKALSIPTQDINLGCYYLTYWNKTIKNNKLYFSDFNQITWAFDYEKINLHSPVYLSNPDYKKKTLWGNEKEKFILTNYGRCIFNEQLPSELGFINKTVKKSDLNEIVTKIYHHFGQDITVEVLDNLKNTGFKYATKSGISVGMDDMIIPKEKEELIDLAKKQIDKTNQDHREGNITRLERYNKTIEIWTNTTNELSDILLDKIEDTSLTKEVNPLFAMLDSGARGSRDQIRQLAAMRGLMAKPSGDIIERAILSNFKEGLTVLEYFISSHGARKGLADTALKTADSGYMTRKLVDVAQDVVIKEMDCKTKEGIKLKALMAGDNVVISLSDRLIDRISVSNISANSKTIVKKNILITPEQAIKIEKAGIKEVEVRSTLTCDTERGVCSYCYGKLLTTNKLVDKGEAVGIIAAQSIGEPGTQLTMRTFHVGGTASASFDDSFIITKIGGKIKLIDTLVVENDEGNLIVVNRTGKIEIIDSNNESVEKFDLVLGAKILKKEGLVVEKGEKIVEWDLHNVPIISRANGVVEFRDLIEGITLKKERNTLTGKKESVILEHKEELHPQLVILDNKGNTLMNNNLIVGTHIMVEEKSKVHTGQTIARIPRQTARTTDITGGLVRISELFEARIPKNQTYLSPVEGIIKLGNIEKRKQKISILDIETQEVIKTVSIPAGKHLLVADDDKVYKGTHLTDGIVNLHEYLEINGENKLKTLLINEVQKIYRAQGVQINDKHIEIIVKQMMRKVEIIESGDFELVKDQKISRHDLKLICKEISAKKGNLPKVKPLLLGITKASLATDSFISAASFQETTKVLTEAAVYSRVDHLRGFKENIILGNLIPAGTGMEEIAELTLIKDEETVENEEDKKKEELKKIKDMLSLDEE